MGRHSAPTKRELRKAARAAGKAPESVSQPSTTADVTSARLVATAEPVAGPALHTDSVAATMPPTSAPTKPTVAGAVAPTSVLLAHAEQTAVGTAPEAIRGPVGDRSRRAATPAIASPVASVVPLKKRRGIAIGKGTPVRLITIGAGVAVLGASVGFMSLGKTVTVTVDGKTTQVTTYASDVEGALDSAGVSASSRDAVTPALNESIASGTHITLDRARPVTVMINGQPTTQYVTARTTTGAIDELGLGAYAVTSTRTSQLPLDGSTINLATYQPVTVVADGRSTVIHTAATTVQGALDDAGLTLGPTDQVAPAVDQPLTAGETITVTRVGDHTVTEEQAIPYEVIEQPDPKNYIGIDQVSTKGVNGAQVVVYQISTVNGVETSRVTLSVQVSLAPTNEVVLKGAKDFPADVNALNWKALGFCESTNNPKAVNKTNGKYFGEYQFSVETWAGVGGTGNPADASPEEQLARAKILYMKYGASQWECGSHLYD